MNFTKIQQDPRAQIALDRLNESHNDLSHKLPCVTYLDKFSFPHIYGSTAGPFGGIGGQAMTTFQIDAFYDGKKAAVFCGDKFIKIIDDFQITHNFR